MAYKAEFNEVHKTSRLVWFATNHRSPHRPVGSPNRSVVIVNGRKYHVTKGWR